MKGYQACHCILRNCYDFDVGIQILQTCREFYTPEAALVLFSQVTRDKQKDIINRIPLLLALELVNLAEYKALSVYVLERMYDEANLCNPELVNKTAQLLDSSRIAKDTFHLLGRSSNVTPYVVDQVAAFLSKESPWIYDAPFDALSEMLTSDPYIFEYIMANYGERIKMISRDSRSLRRHAARDFLRHASRIGRFLTKARSTF